MAEINRREFVIAAACCACACMTGNLAVAEDAPATSTIDIGVPADFANGEISAKFIRDGIIISRNDDRITAMTSRCSHKRSTLTVRDNSIFCPNHKSTFSARGTPTGGPAKGPLVHYGISLNDDGRLIVDKSKQFDEGQWDDAAASVKVN